MRKLILVSTAHDAAEMMAFAEDDQYQEEIRNRMWSAIYRGISRLPNDLSGTKVFAEGVALEDPTQEEPYSFVITNLPKGRQMRLLRDLMSRGAQPEVTEGVFYKEHERLAEEMSDYFEREIAYMDLYEDTMKVDEFMEIEKEIIDRRDREIANNINKRLKQNETGILILGTDHEPLKYLDGDIEVEFIDPELEVIVREAKKRLDELDESDEQALEAVTVKLELSTSVANALNGQLAVNGKTWYLSSGRKKDRKRYEETEAFRLTEKIAKGVMNNTSQETITLGLDPLEISYLVFLWKWYLKLDDDIAGELRESCRKAYEEGSPRSRQSFGTERQNS